MANGTIMGNYQIINMRCYELSKQKNIRDLGGLIGQDGKTIKYGRLFRGGAIYKMNEEDEVILKSLHITDIIDFRSKEEFINHPEIQLEGVTYHNLPTFKEKKKSEEYSNKKNLKIRQTT